MSTSVSMMAMEEEALLDQGGGWAQIEGGADRTKPYFYLAGKMTGLPKFNFPMFDTYAGALREQGYNILNPAELGSERERMIAYENEHGLHETNVDPDAPTWEACLKRDLAIVIDDNCVGVMCMPGWEQSSGARLETFVATALGLPIYLVDLTDEENPVLVEINRFDAMRAADVSDG